MLPSCIHQYSLLDMPVVHHQVEKRKEISVGVEVAVKVSLEIMGELIAAHSE